jgi:RHS repeat-associated protein
MARELQNYRIDPVLPLDFAEARMYAKSRGRFTSPDPLLSSGSAGLPRTWNRYVYVGDNPLVITDPLGLSWYYNSSSNSYKWFGDNDTVDDGYSKVVGDSGRAGSYVYQTEDGQWITLNPNSNSWSSHGSQEDATKLFGGLYQCGTTCGALADSVSEQSAKKATTVAIVAGTGVAVGTGVGVAMAATGVAVGGAITTLGLAEAGAVTAEGTATVAVTFTTHGTVHAATEGFSQAAAESAIRTEVQNIVARAATSGEFWGKVTVGGSTIVYRAFTLADGTIRIGTYYDPTKK